MNPFSFILPHQRGGIDFSTDDNGSLRAQVKNFVHSRSEANAGDVGAAFPKER